MSEELSDLEKSLQLPDDWTEEREANSRKLLVERMAFLARFDHPMENSRLITVLVNECKIHGAHPTMEYFYDLPDQKVWPGYEPIKEALENLGYEDIPELNLNNDIKFLNGDPDAYHPTPEEVRGEELRMMKEVYGISEEEQAELDHLETIYDKNLYMKCDSRINKEDEVKNENNSESNDSELEKDDLEEQSNPEEVAEDSSEVNEEQENTTENEELSEDDSTESTGEELGSRKSKEEINKMSIEELLAEQDRVLDEEEKLKAQEEAEKGQEENLDNSDENEVEAGKDNSVESGMPRERTKEEIGDGISIDDIEGDDDPNKNPEPEKTNSQKGFKPKQPGRTTGRGMPTLDGGMGGMHGHHGGGLGETLTAYGSIAAKTLLQGAVAVGSGFVNTTSNALLPSRRKMKREHLANSKVEQIKNSRESVEDLFSKYKSNLNIDGEPATDIQKELVKQKLENKLGHHINRLAEGGEMAGRKNMSPESKEALNEEIAKTESVVNEMSESVESDNSENIENMKKMLKNIQNLLSKLFGGKTKEADEPSMGM